MNIIHYICYNRCSQTFRWHTTKLNVIISMYHQFFFYLNKIAWLTARMTYIMLPTILGISNYMWLMCYLVLNFVCFFMFQFFKVKHVPVAVRAPQLVKLCSITNSTVRTTPVTFLCIAGCPTDGFSYEKLGLVRRLHELFCFCIRIQWAGKWGFLEIAHKM
jgi:hypothetical protein